MTRGFLENFGVGDGVAIGDSTGAAAQRAVAADFDCANKGSSRPVGRKPFLAAIPTTSPFASTTGAPAASFGIAPLIWNASFFGSDPKKDAFQISGAIPNDAAGAPVVDAKGEVVGIAAKNGLRPTGLLDPLLAQSKSAATARWAAAPVESPIATPSPTPKFSRNPRVISNPAPRYPYEARMLRSGPTTGSGKFRVTFGTNGLVKSVQTVESTGQTILDQAAIKGLQTWRAEPGAQDWTVLVPITFQP